MRTTRALVAADPLVFGRATARPFDAADAKRTMSDDLRLFGTTFVAGFLFVAILVA